MAEETPTIDYSTKIRDGSITVGEAFDAVLDKKLTDSNRKNISSLKRQIVTEGIDLNSNYFDTYQTREYNEALDPTTNTSGTSRWKDYGAFETQFSGLVSGSKRNEPYVRLTNSNKVKGFAASFFSLTGVQDRGKDPMRGLVPSAAMDQIYQEALSGPSYTITDTKTGKDKTIVIDPEARDYLIYEKYTGQRVQSNIGPEGLKIADFNFYEGKNGQQMVEVRGKTSGQKTRPEVVYSGEFAEFLKDKIDRAKANLSPDADLNKVNLFQTTKGAVDKLWDTTIRPKLEERFSEQLPKGKQGSHSTIRKILARQLKQEFEFPLDALKAWMGHAGAGVNAAGDITEDSYTGQVPDKRVGEMTNVLIRNDARNVGAASVNTLFINRNTGFANTLNYPTPEQMITFETAGNLSAPPNQGRPLTEGELFEIDQIARGKGLDRQVANIKKEQEVSELRTEAARKRAERKAQSKTTVPLVDVEAQEPETIKQPDEEFSESLKDKLRKRGYGDMFKLGLGAGIAGVGVITNPAETLADVGIGLAGRAVGLAGGPTAAISGIVLGPTPAGAGSDQPDAPATQQQLMTQTYTLQEEIPSMKAKRDQLGRENLLSAGFMTRQRNQLEGEENAGQ